MGDSVYRAHHDVYVVSGFDRRDRGAARDAKGAGRGPRPHPAGELSVPSCDMRGHAAVWPPGRRARQGGCIPAGRNRLYGRLAAVRPFGLARSSYSGAHRSGRRLRGGHGQQHGYHYRVVSGARARSCHGYPRDLRGPRHDVWPRARRHAGGKLSMGEHLPHQPAHWRHLVYRGALHATAC